MPRDLKPQVYQGLERSCHEGIVAAPGHPGIERIEARFAGSAFEPHRHDTYAIGLTIAGVQTFRYRGQQRFSLPGNILVLHPDEEHDGGAATADGLRYRMLYLEPSLLRRGLGHDHASLPFVAQPVFIDHELADALSTALASLDEMLDELFVDDLIVRIAAGLARRAHLPLKIMGPLAVRQAQQARDLLAASHGRAVRSDELERATGLDRYALARHFRAVFGTSPHRFLVMRRLEQARAMMMRGERLAEVAAAAGFADQAHFTRHFKKAYGITPGRWSALIAMGRGGY